MKIVTIATAMLTYISARAACPDGNMSPIGANSIGTGKMPYQITLDYAEPWYSFFRINDQNNGEMFPLDVRTDQGKQIYAMLLAAKTQCRTLTIYTGNQYGNAKSADWKEIKKIVLN
jgi:hypothetical protein